jgi:hypothetical protein
LNLVTPSADFGQPPSRLPLGEWHDEIFADLARLSGDPVAFVHWAFPWGEEDGPLAAESGPEAWQTQVLQDVKDGLPLDRAILEAVASGHGVGKSALVSWLILWGISTLEDTRGVITANTETQLRTKTWAELGKWYQMFIARELFKLTATAIYSADPLHERTWRIDMVPWSERNTEAFAGLHNKGRRIILIFDEASAIPDVIWETSEGALTDSDTQILWAVFGNPTRASGRFRQCFPGGDRQHRWRYYRVDSRTVRFSNKEKIREWIDDYGVDSDFVRVRILGEFPRFGILEFIGEADVALGVAADALASMHDPLILGVDVARFGDNESVIYPRRGLDARTLPLMRFMGLDTVQLAAKVAEVAIANDADAIFVDEGGVGAGVVDNLRRINKLNVIGIQFGGTADRLGDENSERYANKRAEMWGLVRWNLRHGLAIPNDEALKAQLMAPQYGFNLRDAIQLEKKSDMVKRGAASPDIADALALTFAYPVAKLPIWQRSRLVTSEWDPTESGRLQDVESTPSRVVEWGPYSSRPLESLYELN